MNFVEALGSEFQEVREETRDGQPVHVVVGVRSYPTDADDLWDALTNKDRLPRWFLPVSGEMTLGGRYQLEGNAGGEITACDPPHKLAVTWEIGQSTSWVEIDLAQDGKATKLTLRHIHPQDPKSEDHWKTYGPGATGVGWDLGFMALHLHLTSDNGLVDQETVNSWVGTEAGKTFIRACAANWGNAHVAAGTDPATANAMAKATGDFYTGE